MFTSVNEWNLEVEAISYIMEVDTSIKENKVLKLSRPAEMICFHSPCRLDVNVRVLSEEYSV